MNFTGVACARLYINILLILYCYINILPLLYCNIDVLICY